MKRVLLTATVQSHICQFHKPLMKMLKEHGWEVHVAARNNLAEKNGLRMEYADQVFDIPFERSPLSGKNISAYKALKKLLSNNTYDVIHTNTPVASVLTRMAEHKYRHSGTNVFYTAHGFHFYDGAPLKNWMLYYPIERFLSRWTDTLITINKEDYDRAKRSFHAKKTVYMPGVGVDLSRFEFEFTKSDKEAKRQEIGVPSNATLLMSVGELNRNKNHEVVVRALKLLDDPNIHYCIAGEGPLRDYLLCLADELGVGEQVHLLGYRNDVPELYKAADICCFPSIREGLGLAALEAMACGIPVVAADNRGTRDIIVDHENGILYKPSDVDALTCVVQEILGRRDIAKEIRETARESVKRFSVDCVLDSVKEIYQL